MTVNVQKRRSFRIRRVSRTTPKNVIPPAKRLYFLLTAISAAGVLIGACSRSASALPYEIRTSCSFSDSFIGSFAAVMVYILVCFLGGTSSAGAAGGYLMCIFKGMGAGFLSAEIFRGGAASVNIITALNVLPFEAVSMAAVIFAARENIRMSRHISEKACGKEGGEGDSSDCLRLYLMKFGVITFFAAGGALTDGVMSVIAGNMP